MMTSEIILFRVANEMIRRNDVSDGCKIYSVGSHMSRRRGTFGHTWDPQPVLVRSPDL